MRRAVQTQSTERLSIRCMSLGVITFVAVMSVLAFLLVQWQVVTVPVEAAAHYVPRPMVEMVTGWETIDYIDTTASSVPMHDHGSDRDSLAVDGQLVNPTGLHLTGLQKAGEPQAATRTGHPWWWRMQS
jgi:hypothetical protein